MAPAGAPGSLLAIDVSNTHTGLALWSAGGLELEPAEHWQIATETTDEVWQRSADHQRADEKAEGVSQVALIPTSCDLHADRIDASEA